jgi:hypothetical protein
MPSFETSVHIRKFIVKYQVKEINHQTYKKNKKRTKKTQPKHIKNTSKETTQKTGQLE